MTSAVDSSIIVASLVEAEVHYAACDALLRRERHSTYAHGLVETFNTITGGRSGIRMPASAAAELIEQSVLPSVETVTLSTRDLLRAMHEAESRGVRGAAIYDFLHLVAARKAGASRLYTLDLSDFQSFHRSGDPEIVHP